MDILHKVILLLFNINDTKFTSQHDNTTKLFSDCVHELLKLREHYESARFSYFDIDEESYYILQIQQLQCRVIAIAISTLLDLNDQQGTHQKLIHTAQQSIKVHTVQPLYQLCLDTLEKIKGMNKQVFHLNNTHQKTSLVEELNYSVKLSIDS